MMKSIVYFVQSSLNAELAFSSHIGTKDKSSLLKSICESYASEISRLTELGVFDMIKLIKETNNIPIIRQLEALHKENNKHIREILSCKTESLIDLENVFNGLRDIFNSVVEEEDSLSESCLLDAQTRIDEPSYIYPNRSIRISNSNSEKKSYSVIFKQVVNDDSYGKYQKNRLQNIKKTFKEVQEASLLKENIQRLGNSHQQTEPMKAEGESEKDIFNIPFGRSTPFTNSLIELESFKPPHKIGNCSF